MSALSVAEGQREETNALEAEVGFGLEDADDGGMASRLVLRPRGRINRRGARRAGEP